MMPDGSINLGFWSFIGGICLFVLSQILSAIGLGRWIGKLESRIGVVEKTEESHAQALPVATRAEQGLTRAHERITEHGQELQRHEQAIKDVVALFVREDGEQRFVTDISHDKWVTLCHGQLAEKFANIGARFEDLKKDIETVKTSQEDNLKTIVSEIRKVKP